MRSAASRSVLVCLVLAWRAGVGVADMREAGETTMVLGFPFWMTYLVMVPGLALSGVVGLHVAWEQWRDRATTGVQPQPHP